MKKYNLNTLLIQTLWLIMIKIMIKIKMQTLLENVFFLTLYYLAINFHN